MDKTSSKIKTLRKNYIAKLSEDFSFWFQNTNEHSSFKHFEALKNYFHKLSGSGGSFGFNNISVYAKSAETLLQNTLIQVKGTKDEQVFSFEHFQELAKVFESLNAEINAALEENEPDHSSSEKRIIKNDESMSSVWILDDDCSFAGFLGEQLESFGFNVSTFSDINSFQNAWLLQPPSFLIADVNIDEGEDFYDIFTKTELNLGVAEIIMISSSDTLESRIQAVRFGALTFLPKPFDVAKLANLLRDCITDNNAPPGKVLVIDDDEELSQLYQLALQDAGMQAHVVNKPADALIDIQEHNPDLVLIDLYMPGINGTELAAVIRQHEALASLPIVYLSSESDVQRQSAALARGADDFLTKPIDPSTLALAVRSRIRRARQLQKLINRDSLTGLLKHGSIKDALFRELKRAKRKNEWVTVCMLDIDHFKKVNDTHGHAAGDMVIASLATLLTQTLRQTDSIGRYGGEEFLLVMPDCDASSAEQILNRVRTRFEAIKFTSGSEVFVCTLSAGYLSTVCDQQFNQSYEDLIEEADGALYEAKQNGRNRVIASRKRSR